MSPTQRPASRFLLFSCGIGMVLLFLIPPYQVPDEPMHFRRAMAVANGDFFASEKEGMAGSTLPATLPAFERIHLRHMIGSIDMKYSVDRLTSSAQMGAGRDLTFLAYPTSAVYSPVPYLFSASGVALVEAFGGGYLAALYMGRAFNLLAGCVLVALAFFIAPRAAPLLLVIYCLPMTLFVYSSLSADVLTISLSWLVVALVIRDLESDQSHEFIGLPMAFASGLLVLTKPIFVLIAVLPVISLSLRARWRLAGFHALVVCVAGVLAGLITTSSLGSMRIDVQTDPGAQIGRTVSAPASVAGLVFDDLIHGLPRYAVEAVGRLGWLDTPIPRLVTLFLIVAVLLIAMATTAPPKIDWRLRLTMVALVVATATGIVWSNFVLWTPPGATSIEGVQGRHFLPLLPMALLPLSGALARFHRFAMPSAVLTCAVGSVVTMAVLVLRYWL